MNCCVHDPSTWPEVSGRLAAAAGISAPQFIHATTADPLPGISKAPVFTLVYFLALTCCSTFYRYNERNRRAQLRQLLGQEIFHTIGLAADSHQNTAPIVVRTCMAHMLLPGGRTGRIDRQCPLERDPVVRLTCVCLSTFRILRR